MTDSVCDVRLTEEQQAVVDLPVDARVLVTAGAGTGKTTTMVRRVEALTGGGRVSTGDIFGAHFLPGRCGEDPARDAQD